MKDKKLERGINELKNVVMTDSEKSDIYKNIMSFSAPTKPIQSPWFAFSFSIVSSRSRLVYYIIIPLIIILSSGGAVFASQDSLPDSILYPLKVKVLEPIEGALTISVESKANYESKLAKKRLVEAEILASNDKLDSTEEKKINTLLTKHTENLNIALSKVNDMGLMEEADAINMNFRAEMNAHARVLDILVNKKEGNQNNQIENKDRGNDNQISNTARVGAEKIKNTINKTEKKNFEKFKNKREEVESLINATNEDVSVNTEDKTEEYNPIVDDTQKTIDQAKAYLYDASKKDEEGDWEEAYSSLLDSESTVKEAKIFLHAGLRIK